MNIEFCSVGAISSTTLVKYSNLTLFTDSRSFLGQQIDNINEGIQPTYGMCAEDMGFQTFIMTVNWSK